MKRRGVLARIGVAFPTALGGCLAGFGPDRSPSNATGSAERPVSVRTPPEGDCEPSPRLRPTPDSPRAKPYPDHPDSLTAATARAFARAFERAFQYNARLPEYGTVAVSATVPDRTVSETRRGYRLGVEGRVSFGDAGSTGTRSAEKASTGTRSAATPSATRTPLPSGTRDFSVWYFLTDRFALRNGSVDELRTGGRPDLTGADTVSCAATDGRGGSGRVPGSDPPAR